jgi:non-ribosomal peptide synthetase component F
MKNQMNLISIFGILKSGGAYIPIDIEFPQERINFILKDTQSKVITFIIFK